MPRSDVQRRPTLLNSCARAATAAEARFRISYPFLARDSRILAVDEIAASVVCRAAWQDWSGGARFLTFGGQELRTANLPTTDAAVFSCDGSVSTLSRELASADVAVMVASSAGAEAAEAIGRACFERRIMTAGVVLGEDGERIDDAVLALRPYAMVLVVSHDESDLLDLLTALRV